MWKCKKCGYDRIETSICVSCWIDVEVNTKSKEIELDGCSELNEVCWDDPNQTIDGYTCCKCGNNSTQLKEIAKWED